MTLERIESRYRNLVQTRTKHDFGLYVTSEPVLDGGLPEGARIWNLIFEDFNTCTWAVCNRFGQLRECCKIHRLKQPRSLIYIYISLSDLRWAGILIKSLVNPLISVLFFYPRRFGEDIVVRTSWNFAQCSIIIFTNDFWEILSQLNFFELLMRRWGVEKNLESREKIWN